tara:strand:- start:70 stop:471 length:402 start_codon:yes stop_codon:yes gene_type:complete
MTVRELFSKIQYDVEYYANEIITWFGEGVIKLYEFRWLDFTVWQAIFTLVYIGTMIGMMVTKASEVYKKYMGELEELDWNRLENDKESVPKYEKVWIYTKLFAVFIWEMCWHIFSLILLSFFVLCVYQLWVDK